MRGQRIFLGSYRTHDHKEVKIRRTCVARRAYTHAVIPLHTTRIRHVPSAQHGGLTVPVEEPCEPWYDKAQFCSSLALAHKKMKPGYLLVEVHEFKPHAVREED